MATAALKRTGAEASRPLYVQLATVLGERISSGAYAIGNLLPTEAELGKSFGVSRYTVRQAIQHLRTQGLVSARKGVGTRVEATAPDPQYSHAVRSLDELMQYARETVLDVAEMDEVEARGPTAVQLGCRPGKRWLRAAGIRYAIADHTPMCWNEVWIDAAYADLRPEIGTARTAICALIESRYGETIVEVEQTLSATILEADQARQLEAEPGEPALRITRRYFVTGRRLIELANSIHPADRFTYSMTMRRGMAD
jgi:DNA-binding GntR family transcriptional regulator